MDVSGLAAIVTGGASGMGGATAARLAKVGTHVAILDLDTKRGEARAAAIGGRFLTPPPASLPQEALGEQVPFRSRLGNASPMLNGAAIHLDGAIGMASK